MDVPDEYDLENDRDEHDNENREQVRLVVQGCDGGIRSANLGHESELARHIDLCWGDFATVLEFRDSTRVSRRESFSGIRRQADRSLNEWMGAGGRTSEGGYALAGRNDGAPVTL